MTDPETEQPVPGVNVIEKGTRNGTTTNFDGEYSLELDNPTGVLVFSYLGYKPLEVEINGSATLDVDLEANLDQLDEVTIVKFDF